MGSFFVRAAAGLTMLAAATMAMAQEDSTNQVNAVTDWSVFEEKDPRQCWAVTTYKESLNTDAQGVAKSVTRGEILLMVFFRPDAGADGQVAFTGGYPFAPGSTVSFEVDGSTYELFTEGEWAWPASPQDDAKIVTSMKRGANAVLTARSSRGTITKDTFSLLGFTAAYEDADKRCDS
ncbi:MAG: hypothetical protein KDK26_15420 [Roseivivax sp.]|nr:hypothetical protein [Roseivivax sp.]